MLRKGENFCENKRVKEDEFSEITPDKWDELKPFLDTALLPVTGLDGSESPATLLRNNWNVCVICLTCSSVLSAVEPSHIRRFILFMTSKRRVLELAQVAGNLKQAGFRHVVIVTLVEELADDLTSMGESIDLVITPNESEQVQERIASMWQS